MNIIVMGPQGSGKSTQAELLAEKLGVAHIQTGEIYRKIAREDTPLGKKIKQVLDNGQLVDDETTLNVVDRYIAEVKSGFVLDGFPRTLVQAERELFPVDKVIYLGLSDAEASKRLLLRSRIDDTEELIARRLALYHQTTEPILDFYRKQGKLVEVDGSLSIDQIHQDITSRLNTP